MANRYLEYSVGIAQIQKRVPVFPEPKQLEKIGKKLYQNHLLNSVASSLGHERPITTVMQRPSWDDFTALRDSKSTIVFKREFSEESNHFISCSSNKVQSDFVDLSKGDALWAGMEIKPFWFQQAYIPQLRLMGELRSFVVNGMIIYTCFTLPNESRPGRWSVSTIRTVRPLSQMRYPGFSLYIHIHIF